MKKIKLFSLIMLSLCLVFASMTTLAADPQYGGKIVVRTDQDPISLDPFRVGSQAFTWDLAYALYGYLFVIGPDGEFQPDVAESWTNPDEKTFIFNIRQGMKWHDGVELTADDVIFTFEKNLDPDFGSYWHTGIRDYVDYVEKIDDYTVKMALKEPFAPIMYSLLFPIAPQHAYEELGEDFAYNPVGAGPFKFKEWVLNQNLVIEAFDDFYGGRPYVDEVEFLVMDYDTALMAFLSEEIDVLSVSSQDRDMVEDHPNLEYVIQPGTSWSYFGVNQNEPPLDDKLVRQAISYAINRGELIESYFNNTVVMGTGPIIPISWAYNPDVRTYPYNPGRSIQLLREAGYPQGIEITMKCSTGAVEIIELVQYQLGLVGITLNIEPMEWGLLTNAVNNDDFQLHYRTWTRQTDPERGINRQFISYNNANIAGFDNPRVDELALKAAATLDIEERREMYFELQEILAEELPAIFLWFGTFSSAYNNRIENYRLDPYYCYRTFAHMWINE